MLRKGESPPPAVKSMGCLVELDLVSVKQGTGVLGEETGSPSPPGGRGAGAG